MIALSGQSTLLQRSSSPQPTLTIAEGLLPRIPYSHTSLIVPTLLLHGHWSRSVNSTPFLWLSEYLQICYLNLYKCLWLLLNACGYCCLNACGLVVLSKCLNFYFIGIMRLAQCLWLLLPLLSKNFNQLLVEVGVEFLILIHAWLGSLYADVEICVTVSWSDISLSIEF
jgi:hypothetical protein